MKGQFGPWVRLRPCWRGARLAASLALTFILVTIPTVRVAASTGWQSWGVLTGNWSVGSVALYDDKPRMALSDTDRTQLAYAWCDAAECTTPAAWQTVHIVSTTRLTNMKLVTDPVSGHPRIAFADASSIKLALCNGNCHQQIGWSVVDIDNYDDTGAPSSPNADPAAFAVDTSRGLHWAYKMRSGDLVYRMCIADCARASSWSRLVNDLDDVESFSTLGVSLAVDGTKPRLLYEASSVTRQELRWARCDAGCTQGSGWTHTVVPQPHRTTNLATVAIAGGRPRILFASSGSSGTQDIQYMQCRDSDCALPTSWQGPVGIPGTFGAGSAIQLAWAGTGMPVVTYLEAATADYGSVRMAVCTAPDCTVPHSWAQVQTVSPAGAKDGTPWVAVGAAGRLHMAMPRFPNSGTYVVYARCGAASCTGTIDAGPPPRVPGPPSRLNATVGNGLVDVLWGAPTEDGGAPLLGYRLRISPPPPIGEATREFDEQASGEIVRDLENGTEYTFSVAAYNAAGEGPAAETKATPLGPPPAPRDLTPSPGDGKVILSWQPPQSDGGSPLQGYRLSVSPAPDSGATRVLPSTAVSETVEGLTNGTTYAFTLSAHNAYGDGRTASKTAVPTAAESTVSPSPSPSASTSPVPSPTRSSGGGSGGGGGGGGGSGSGSSQDSPSASPLPSPSPAPGPAPTQGSGEESAPVTVERSSGEDRTATAAQASRLSFDPGVQTAFIATAEGPYDALSAGPAAGSLGGPVLLVTANSIPPATRDELTRLRPRRITALGGLGVISDEVLRELDFLAADGANRISGEDRYATAARIATTYFSEQIPIAYVGTGIAFADALAAGAGAARLGGPVLLTDPARLPASTEGALRQLRPGRIVLLGGHAAVSETVRAQIAAATGGMPDRLSGPDRYATAGSVVADAFPSRARVVFIATGERFPDALAAVPAAASLGAPVLLVQPDRIPEPTVEQLRRLRPARIVILGGPVAVTPQVERRLATYAS